MIIYYNYYTIFIMFELLHKKLKKKKGRNLSLKNG